MNKGGGDNGNGAAQAEEQRKADLRGRINTQFGIDAPNSPAAMQFKSEDDEIAKALRTFYGTDSKEKYDEAERNLRFGAARTGNIGGTAYADAESKLAEKNALGATRIDEAVQRALAKLQGDRENTRLNSINLVNSGSGEDAIAAAASGLKQSFSTASAANKENLFGDLFSDIAFSKAAGDSNNQQAQLLAQFYGKKSPIGASTSPSGGRVINY